MFGEFTIFKRLAKKVWRINRSAKELSMVAINSDGFSLANRIRFAKFAKLSPRQTFPLYSTYNYVDQPYTYIGCYVTPGH